jgi:hypothetical protein
VEGKRDIVTKLDGIALGTGIAYIGADVEFTYVVQRRIVIQGVAIVPTDSALGPINLTIITHAPERAKIQRFEDGSTISDLGISHATYAMELSPEKPSMYRLRLLTDEEAQLDHTKKRWFVQDGIGYLRAEVHEHVAVRVHNPGDHDVKVHALLLCLHASGEVS